MRFKDKISFVVQGAGVLVGAFGAWQAFSDPLISWPLVTGGAAWFVGWFIRRKIG